MKKLIFLHIPRTAGSYLSNYFGACGGIYVHGHGSLSEIEGVEKHFNFAFIRNPWDWYVSKYHFEKTFKKLPSFKEYVMTLSEDASLTGVFKKLCYKNGVYSLDYMGRFEDIEKSIRNLITLCNLTPQISYKDFCEMDNKNRVNSSNHNHYTEYYDEELITIIAERDKEIIERFNYIFGDENDA